jgi:hypothetical protein
MNHATYERMRINELRTKGGSPSLMMTIKDKNLPVTVLGGAPK